MAAMDMMSAVTVSEMSAIGLYASINLATTDRDVAFERLQAGDADVARESGHGSESTCT